MHWVAPSEKDATNGTLEKRLWESADQFRANSGLKAQEPFGPILGTIFLRFAEVRFTLQRAMLERAAANRLLPKATRNVIDNHAPRVHRRPARYAAVCRIGLECRAAAPSPGPTHSGRGMAVFCRN